MMYCPRCAAQNAETARFCRSCGADIGAVYPALTGQLVPRTKAQFEKSNTKAARAKQYEKPNSPEQAFSEIGVGLAFLLIVVLGAIFFTHGFMIWIWFLIPGLAVTGKGYGRWLTLKQHQQARTLPPAESSYNFTTLDASVSAVREPVLNVATTQQLDEARRGELAAPFSVTESETRLFETPHTITPATEARTSPPASEAKAVE